MKKNTKTNYGQSGEYSIYKDSAYAAANPNNQGGNYIPITKKVVI
jgi:hypothetical protein